MWSNKLCWKCMVISQICGGSNNEQWCVSCVPSGRQWHMCGRKTLLYFLQLSVWRQWWSTTSITPPNPIICTFNCGDDGRLECVTCDELTVLSVQEVYWCRSCALLGVKWGLCKQVKVVREGWLGVIQTSGGCQGRRGDNVGNEDI